MITYLAFTLPLAIWIMRGFLRRIPEELEHAAMIDGATRLGAMCRVILPLAAPGLATTAMLRFIAALERVPARADVHQRGGAQDAAARAADLRRARRHRLGRGHGHERALHAAGRDLLPAAAQAPHDGMTAGAVKG